MDKLTCIYPLVVRQGEPTAEGGGRPQAVVQECGYCPMPNPPIMPTMPHEGAGLNQSALVMLQEHLRDEHLECSTSTLHAWLLSTERKVTTNGGVVSYLGPREPWDARDYRWIEWILPDGRAWLRAEKLG